MKLKSLLLLCAFMLAVVWPVHAADPLRIFIRAGVKTHHEGEHDHPRFLKEWTELLTARGAKVDGSLEFPTAAQLENADVLIMYAQDAGNIPADQRVYLEKFLKRGGGMVVLHDAVVSNDPQWYKTIIGGAWQNGVAKWLEGPMSLYYVDRTHPITQGVANFDLKDEIYYDLHLQPEIQVLAAAYTPKTPDSDRARKMGTPAPGRISVYDIQPQMWTYEHTLEGGQPYRAFVSIPGHNYTTFDLPQYRAVLLRGIAWAGKRANMDELCHADELASLRYPSGGPSRPEKSREEMIVHPDFKLTLVASEPLINKAMNVNWDAKGRLWVVETPEYPDGRYANPPSDFVQRWTSGKLNPETGRYDRPAHDRISILSDSNGDGVMDKKDVFFEGLELATSFVFYKDGVIVSAAPDIWWLRDTKGTGHADTVTKLYTGLGTRDTHAVINNLRWGFDGWIYATHGYSSGTVTTPDSNKSFGLIGSGVVRFKPDGSAFEQYSSKGGNTWGLHITWDNEVFYTQPTSGDLLMNVVLGEDRLAKGKLGKTTSYKIVKKSPRSYSLIPYNQLPYMQIDLVGSFTAAAGCVIYDGGSWPAAWNYSYFTTEPTINIVHHEVVKPEGVSYTADKVPDRAETEFLMSKDMWVRPIEVRVGPDGAMYIIDFYNQAVIHNDTRGPKHGPRNAAIRPDRDHYYGRIWRVDHKDAQHTPVPDLSNASTATLVQTLLNPNQHVRMTAGRLMEDFDKADAAPALSKMLADASAPAYTRVAALWILHQLGSLTEDQIVYASTSPDQAIRKNALEIAQLPPTSIRGPETKLHAALVERLQDADPRVRLEAIKALGSFEVDAETAVVLARIYSSLNDPWLESALIGTAANNPIAVITAALRVPEPEPLVPLVSQLARLTAAKQDSDLAQQLVIALANTRNASPLLQQTVLAVLAQDLKPTVIPGWHDELAKALKALLASKDPTVPAASLPLIARWDSSQSLLPDVNALTQQLIARIKDTSAPEKERGDLALSLLAGRRLNPDIVPAVVSLLSGNQPAGLQQRVLEALGELTDKQTGAELITAFPKLSPALQGTAFNQLLKRSAWSLALLDALQSKKIDAAVFGPANLYRLRTHPDAEVARRANTVIDELRGPEAKEKDALIAKFTPAVTQPGNVAKGKELFTANCAVCHKFGDLGREVGPNLTGMGAHGAAELLVHILDPNRAVEFTYIAIDFEMKDGEVQTGVIAQENKDSVLVRNSGGEVELKKSDIKSRRSTGRSLMPEGFEALGGDNLRDLLAFVTAADSRYRFIELGSALTADSRRGIYNTPEATNDSLHFVRYGIVSVEGVPFDIVDPAMSPGGVNLMVLKGGPEKSYSFTAFPQKVEAKVGFAAKRLHFLGSVGGWAYPIGGNDVPVLKVTVQYAGGKTEEIVMKNGQEFADYIRPVDVPGSRLAAGIVKDHQVRWATKTLQGTGVIDKLVFESFGNHIAPTMVAVTAEIGEGNGPSAEEAKPAPVPHAFQWQKGKTHVLIVGGGSSHDFQRWFNLADVATLNANRTIEAQYTDHPVDVLPAMKDVDVLYLSNNQPLADPALRKAIFDHVQAGKGLVLVHAALWYNWKDWPEYNQKLVGGGTSKHDKLGEFTVNVVADAKSPVLTGVPASFAITDELYNFQRDDAGAPPYVLAKAKSPLTGNEFPVVWISQQREGRVLCMSLGHDGRAHDLPAYKQLLMNGILWAAGREVQPAGK